MILPQVTETLTVIDQIVNGLIEQTQCKLIVSRINSCVVFELLTGIPNGVVEQNPPHRTGTDP